MTPLSLFVSAFLLDNGDSKHDQMRQSHCIIVQTLDDVNPLASVTLLYPLRAQIRVFGRQRAGRFLGLVIDTYGK